MMASASWPASVKRILEEEEKAVLILWEEEEEEEKAVLILWEGEEQEERKRPNFASKTPLSQLVG